MPEVVEAIHGSFYFTGLQNCFFPKLVRIGAFVFLKCKVVVLNSRNFPVLRSVDDHGFSCCPVTSVSLPCLISVGKSGFASCQSLKSFSASSLQEIGENCFSYCSQLSSIDCDLETEQFRCVEQECGVCLICMGALSDCLKRGTAPKKKTEEGTALSRLASDHGIRTW